MLNEKVLAGRRLLQIVSIKGNLQMLAASGNVGDVVS